MKRYLIGRLQEKSTARGGALLSLLLSMYLGPVQADIAAQSLMMLWGIYEVIKREGVNREAQ